MSRNNNKLTVYEEIKGSINWNRTPMIPLSNKGMVYITPDMCNMFASYCNEAYTVGRVLNHHQPFKCYVPATRVYIISGTYHLTRPNERSLPSGSRTIPSPPPPTSLRHSKSIPTLVLGKQKHIAAVRKLSAIV